MAQTFKLLLIVLLGWLSIELYTNGFEGTLRRLSGHQNETSVVDRGSLASTSRRAADAVQRAHDKSESRVDKLLEDKGISDN